MAVACESSDVTDASAVCDLDLHAFAGWCADSDRTSQHQGGVGYGDLLDETAVLPATAFLGVEPQGDEEVAGLALWVFVAHFLQAQLLAVLGSGWDGNGDC